MIKADMNHTGVRTADRHTDIPKSIEALTKITATDYFHVLGEGYPHAWAELPDVARACDNSGIKCWVYANKNLDKNYVWSYPDTALKCAEAATKAQFPIAGIVFDDFATQPYRCTALWVQQSIRPARKIMPTLKLYIVAYYYQQWLIREVLRNGDVDGVVFPYVYPHVNHETMNTLHGQIESWRRFLDWTMKDRGGKRIALLPMIYASKFSAAPFRPTPFYVENALRIALATAVEGWSDGACTYCLWKDDPGMIDAAARAFGMVHNERAE